MMKAAIQPAVPPPTTTKWDCRVMRRLLRAGG
jgi:hypothetical protein